MKPTLYIMTGLAFSGKTTLAKKLAQYKKAELISFDELWIKLEKQNPTQKLSWEHVREVAKQIILSKINSGKSVVYDDTNPMAKHRDEFRQIAKQAKVAVMVIYTRTPRDIIKQRRKKNLKNPQRHNVDEHNFQTTINQFEEPTDQETHISYTPPQNIDDWLIEASYFL